MSVCLEVAGLNVRYAGMRDDAPERAVVKDVSFQVRSGECVGIVGESGSGKTQVFLSIMGLLGSDARISGRAVFKGRDLLSLRPDELNRLRGAALTMVFQDPMTALTPHLTVGAQMREVLTTHLTGQTEGQMRERMRAMLDRVRIPDPAHRLRQYPHELSGGMRQRVLIAMACLCGPSLLIADEPTTALDMSVQAQVLGLLDGLRRDTGTAIALVTHDVGMLAGRADRIIVLYAGRIVESGPASALLSRPLHPYTAGLLQCVPRWSDPPAKRLSSIPGFPPDPEVPIDGCEFAPRCPRAQPLCIQRRPVLERPADGREYACHFPDDRA